MKNDRIPGAPDKLGAPEPPKGWKERLYDRIHIPLWLLDGIIAGLILLIALFVVLGAIRGNA